MTEPRDRPSGASSSGGGPAPAGAAELRERLLRVDDPQDRWLVREGWPERVDVTAEWRYEVPGWERRTLTILFHLDEARHEVRSLDTLWSSEGAGEWRYTQGPVGNQDQNWVWARGADGRSGWQRSPGFDVRELKGPLYSVVTSSGWTWRGVRVRPELDGRTSWLTVGILALCSVIPAILIAIALLLAVHTAGSLGDARAVGHVVANETSEEFEGARPVIEFVSPGGTPVQFTENVWTNPPEFVVGEAVPVRYHADNPQDASRDGFWALYLAPVIVGGIGLVFVIPIVVVAFFLVVLPKRRLRRRM